MATLQCEIVTPERKVFSCEASFVVLPAAEGEMGVLPMHEPVVTTLNAGSARVTIDGEKEPTKFVVAGGYAQVESERVIILADRAMAVADIDATEVGATLAKLESRLEALKPEDDDYAFAQAELKWFELLRSQAPSKAH